jgi:hypothetical protein
MLILLIGCAINGDYKEIFIDNIQQKLDTQIQIELVPFIELVTEDINFSISKNFSLALPQQQQSPDSSISSTSSFIQSCQQLMHNQQNINSMQIAPNDLVMNKLLNNISRITDERDLFMESIIELQQDKDFLLKQLNKNGLLLNNNNNINNNNNNDSNSSNDVNNENKNNVGSNDNGNNSSNLNNQVDGESDLNKNNLLNQPHSKQQKLSMELVEYKVKMRQLRVEV